MYIFLKVYFGNVNELQVASYLKMCDLWAHFNNSEVQKRQLINLIDGLSPHLMFVPKVFHIIYHIVIKVQLNQYWSSGTYIFDYIQHTVMVYNHLAISLFI